MYISVTKARRLLGKRAETLSDDEVSSLTNQLELLAEIFIDTFNSNGSKKQLGVIDKKFVQEDDGATKNN